MTKPGSLDDGMRYARRVSAALRRRLAGPRRVAPAHSVRRDLVGSFLAEHSGAPSLERRPVDFAVVVPCYNHARWLPAAFASVEAQTMTPREVLLVDDASTDGTWRMMNELQTASSLPAGVVRLLRNERNVGQCETINRSVQETSANVIVVLNDDDYLMHDALASIAGVFAQHPAIALVGARALPVGTQAHLENLKKTVAGSLLSSELLVRISEPATARAYESARQLDMCHSASAFRREAWQAVGGYYPDRERRVVVFSDRDFQLRVNYLYPVAVVENAAFALWRAGSSVDSGRFT